MDKDPDNWWKTAENHIGNGPFTVTGIDEDQRWTFAANENYWQGRPKLDGIEYVYVEDAAVALEAYRAGDLDIVELEPPQIPEVQADPELSEAVRHLPAGRHLQPGHEPDPGAVHRQEGARGVRLRIDRETLCAEVRSGDCAPTLSWIPPGRPRRDRNRQVRLRSRRRRSRHWPNPPTAARRTCPRSSSPTTATSPAAAKKSSGSRARYRDILGVELDHRAD